MKFDFISPRRRPRSLPDNLPHSQKVMYQQAVPSTTTDTSRLQK